MKNFSNKISKEQATDALLRSGYLLEGRLYAFLDRREYYVETNVVYPDPDSGKSRELDLQAITSLSAGPREFDRVHAVLLIECVNNLQPIAFVTKKPQVEFLHHYDVKLAGLPVKISIDGNYWNYLPVYLEMDKYHHYCKGRVATQFCSFTKKKRKNIQEWMATHIEEHFDCFRKLSASVEYFIDEQFKNSNLLRLKNVNIEFYYPVVVVQGELLDARPSKGSVNLINANHIQYRQSGLVGTVPEDYQIDVVTERFFPKYIEIIEQEISKTARLLRRRSATVRKSIDEIVRHTRIIRPPEKIRAALEF